MAAARNGGGAIMDEATDRLQRYGGFALIAAGIGTVGAMAHHPSGAHGGALGPIVHGVMILLLALQAFGFAGMAVWRGVSRPLIVAGAVAYAISLFGHVAAATINGFVVPALASRGHGTVGHDIFLFAWQANQAFAKLGVLATSAAYLLWSVDYLTDADRRLKAIGLVGLVTGITPAALLLGGAIRMNVAGAFLSYAVFAAWAVVVGLVMVRAARGSRQRGASEGYQAIP